MGVMAITATRVQASAVEKLPRLMELSVSASQCLVVLKYPPENGGFQFLASEGLAAWLRRSEMKSPRLRNGVKNQ